TAASGRSALWSPGPRSPASPLSAPLFSVKFAPAFGGGGAFSPATALWKNHGIGFVGNFVDNFLRLVYSEVVNKPVLWM
ncbi:MAG: hypothetical protein Q8Q41_04610, partial [bacterium]|nr:hypothetical protein [bacterium]